MRFSERYGYEPVRKIIQIDSISVELRNGLWSLLQIHIWARSFHHDRFSGSTYIASIQDVQTFFRRLWFEYYRLPLDTLSNRME